MCLCFFCALTCGTLRGRVTQAPVFLPNVLRWNPVLDVPLVGESQPRASSLCVHVCCTCRVFVYAVYACVCMLRLHVARVMHARMLCICMCACFAHVCGMCMRFTCCACVPCVYTCVCTCVTSGMSGLPCEVLDTLTLGVRNGQGPVEGEAGGW